MIVQQFSLAEKFQTVRSTAVTFNFTESSAFFKVFGTVKQTNKQTNTNVRSSGFVLAIMGCVSAHNHREW